METVHANSLSYLVIGVYFLFLLSLGFIFKRLNKDDTDYFRAGSRSSWWLVGMSIVMSGISTQTFIANAGVAYRSGFSIHWIYVVNTVCYLLLFLGIAAWYRQARVTTFAEMVRDRFGVSFQQFFTYYSIVMVVMMGALGLYQLSLFASTIFHFPIERVIFVTGLVVVFYTLLGGNWAILAADFLQGLVLFSMALLMAILSLQLIGGFEGFFGAVKSQGLQNDFAMVTRGGEGGNYGFSWLIGVGVIQIYAILGIMGSQRYFSCKDGRHARKAALLAMVVSVIGMAVFFIPPMVARLLFAAEIEGLGVPNPTDVSYAFMSMQLLPNGFVPLMVVAMFSAQMSTLDTALNANSAVFVRNGYPALMRLLGNIPSEDPKYLLRLGRCFTSGLGICLIALALLISRVNQTIGVFEIFLKMVGLVLVPMLLPLFMGIFVRGTPMWSGWFTFGVGASVSMTSFFLGQTGLMDIPVHLTVVVISVVGVVAYLATIPFYWKRPAAEQAQVDEFFVRTRTPVDFETEIGTANDAQQLKLIGTLAVVLGVFILSFLIFPNPLGGRLQILAVSLGVISVGIFLLWARRRVGSDCSNPVSPGPNRNAPVGIDSADD